MIRRLGALLGALALATTAAAGSPDVRLLEWSELDGWAADDHHAALSAFRETCGDLDDAPWPALCNLADEVPARDFFERFFLPVLVHDGNPGFFTGYFEPEVDGALTADATYRWPLRKPPPELTSGEPWLTREEIETSGVLDGRGLEIAWLRDPVEKFFLQIQGSGRVALPDGSTLRVGYGGKNGHPYRSLGEQLVRLGHMEAHEVSADRIADWVRAKPKARLHHLWHNASYVFFREVSHVAPGKGPLGAMNRSLTAGRSLAVDPDIVPLGAPVWIETVGKTPRRRLMVAQDTGSAIKGPQRGDIYIGSGDAAGLEAGRIRDHGRLVVLLPIDRALALAGVAP